MSDDRPTKNALVPMEDLIRARNRNDLLAKKPNNRLPDVSWVLLQEGGERAAEHLHHLLHDPLFSKRKIHDQIRLIELGLLRAYGMPEATLKISKADNHDPRTGNELRRLASQARLPEILARRNKSPTRGSL